jgi:hypothetical protein
MILKEAINIFYTWGRHIVTIYFGITLRSSTFDKDLILCNSKGRCLYVFVLRNKYLLFIPLTHTVHSYSILYHPSRQLYKIKAVGKYLLGTSMDYNLLELMISLINILE